MQYNKPNMSRIDKYLNKIINDASSDPSSDPFVICPVTFFSYMTPEQFIAVQSIYKRAYERAWKKVYGDEINFTDLDFGGGI